MAETKIEWTATVRPDGRVTPGYTFNHVIGCAKVAAGCQHCYAEAFSKRTGKAKWGPEGTRVKTSESYWRQPLKWNREAAAAGERRRVFCASLADVFESWDGPIMDHHGRPLLKCDYCGKYWPDDENALSGSCECGRLLSRVDSATLDDVRADLFKLIDATPNLDWMLLTCQHRGSVHRAGAGARQIRHKRRGGRRRIASAKALRCVRKLVADEACRIPRFPLVSRGGSMKVPSKRRAWTRLESARLRRDYGRMPVSRIAAKIRRTPSSVYQHARLLGLTKNPWIDWARLDTELRRLHAQGWTDSEIAVELRRIAGREIARETVGDRRGALGLPHNGLSEHRRRTVAAKTRKQLDRAGVSTLAELRVKAWGDAARRCGWPRNLRPRHVQILNVLFQRGPMTRQQIADAVGMPWKGSRKSLTSNDAEGTYLWHLVRRGLVVRLPRLVKGTGKARSTHLYTLALGVAPHFEQETS